MPSQAGLLKSSRSGSHTMIVQKLDCLAARVRGLKTTHVDLSLVHKYSHNLPHPQFLNCYEPLNKNPRFVINHYAVKSD